MLMEMALADDPPSGREPEPDQSDPRNLWAMAAEFCCVFGKILRGLGFFSSGTIYRPKGVVRGLLRGRDGRRPRSHLDPRWEPAPGLWASPRVALLAPFLIYSIKNCRKFSSNSKNISRSNFLQQNMKKTENWHWAYCQ